MLNLLLAISLVFPHAVYSGVASWYADPKAPQGSFYAAVPGYHYGHPFYIHVRPYKPTIRCVMRTGNAACRIRVRVGDFCGCPGGRTIDLSWRAFSQFAPLSRGLTRVIIER